MEHDSSQWKRKFREHRKHAEERGLESHLTFDQYVDKVREAGITSPEQLGRGGEDYQLARIGDIGNYTNENCRFITTLENRREAFQNGCHDERNLRLSEARTGLTKENSEHYKRVSESLKGRTAATDAFVVERALKMTGRNKHNDPSYARIAERQSRDFVLTSPHGEIIEGKNLTEFCTNNDLRQPKMSEVLNGSRNHHKGWTGYYGVLEPDLTGCFPDE